MQKIYILRASKKIFFNDILEEEKGACISILCRGELIFFYVLAYPLHYMDCSNLSMRIISRFGQSRVYDLVILKRKLPVLSVKTTIKANMSMCML